jgi:hypothetical protein
MELYGSAPSKLTKEAQKTPPGFDDYNDFNKFYEDHKASYEKLQILFREEPLKLKEISRHLAVFRETSRWFDYASCRWSENYDAIEDAQDKIYDLQVAIDKKYKLGRYMR